MRPMPKGNEQTSKRVAAKAGKLMTDIDAAIKELEHAEIALKAVNDAAIKGLAYAVKVLTAAKSAAASALTQAPDKKRKVVK